MTTLEPFKMFWRKMSKGDVKASDESDIPNFPDQRRRKLSNKGRNTFPRLATRRRGDTMDVFKFDTPVIMPPPKSKKSWVLADEENPAGVKNAVVNPSDVVWLDDTYFAISDSEGHRILIFDITGRLVTALCNKLIWPNCIAVTKDLKLVVTDRKTKLVRIYDLNGECISSFGETILYIGEEEYDLRPHGVTVNNRGQIIVTETFQSVIKVYSPEGELLQRIASGGRGISELDLPFYVTCDERDNIIVSDNMNYAVKIFDSSGNFKFKIGSSQEWGQRNFQCPFGVCLDQRNNILVADTNRIVAYSPEGEILGDVVGKHDNCKNPTGIAVNSQGDLVVTENNLDYSNVKMYRTFYESDTF